MKVFELSFQKATDPITYNHLERLRETDRVYFDVSGSQVIKRLEQHEYELILMDLHNGHEITIK